MSTRTLVLLRHGHYDPDDGGRLTAIGREQARLAGKYLATLRFDAIWSSTLPRARETADIVSNGLSLSPRHSGLLREGIYTKVEGYDVTPAERREDLRRADAAYAKFFRKSRTERTELLVCHGNLIRYFMCRALHAPVLRWLRMTTTHCGISRVVIRDTGAVRVVSYNESAHLPLDLVT
ncbi:MAG: histidine phosphatase family protein [Deltaproteobacteria bacterium]|nr:histidine phosphatase family protein [Deltaproteobacteria bacterium]